MCHLLKRRLWRLPLFMCSYTKICSFHQEWNSSVVIRIHQVFFRSSEAEDWETIFRVNCMNPDVSFEHYKEYQSLVLFPLYNWIWERSACSLANCFRHRTPQVWPGSCGAAGSVAIPVAQSTRKLLTSKEMNQRFKCPGQLKQTKTFQSHPIYGQAHSAK